MRQAREHVCRGGRNDDDIRLATHRDMARGALVLHREHLDLDGPMGQRLKGERRHELRGALRHDHLHGRTRLHKVTGELDHLVHGDRPRHCQHDEAAGDPRQAFSSHSRRSPSSVRSSSTRSMPFASGAIVAARPPVASTRGLVGPSSAMIRASSPSTSPT